MKIKPGIYFGMPAKNYFAAEGLNKSSMMDLIKSPHHYKTAKRIKKEPTSSMIFGSAMHLAILEPEKYDELVLTHSYKTSKINKDGQIFLHPDIKNQVDTIVGAVNIHPIASKLTEGNKEVSLFWKDLDFDFICKARPDIINKDLDLIIDLKYCRDASYKEFAKQAANLKYHWQAKWYLTGAEILFNKKFNFIFICIEGDPTYSIAIYLVTNQMLDKASYEIDACRNIYLNCLTADEWPGYPEKLQELYLPNWA